MLKKRIIGNIIVKDNIAVQSFSYRYYLPIGKPVIVLENLDNWGVDEIAITVIDREDNGPDLKLLEKINKYKITTPLIYGGGIKTKDEANEVISLGVERIMLDSIIYEYPDNLPEIYNELGSQALLLSLPIISEEKGIFFYNYKKREKLKDLNINKILDEKFFSEIVLIDVNGEGGYLGFDKLILNYMKELTSIPFITFGGITTTRDIKNCLGDEAISAVMIGNSLNYKENKIYHLKKNIQESWLRKHNLK